MAVVSLQVTGLGDIFLSDTISAVYIFCFQCSFIKTRSYNLAILYTSASRSQII